MYRIKASDNYINKGAEIYQRYLKEDDIFYFVFGGPEI